MIKVTIRATIEFQVEIDPENSIVKEYDSRQDLADDCVSYMFDPVLPVIAERGVVYQDRDILEVELIEE